MHPASTKSHTMAPAMNRQDSRRRAERCWRLRVRGRTWQEIADEEGFGSRRAAQKAVEKLLERDPPSDVNTLRRAMGDGITMLRADLLDCLDDCKAKGQHIRVAQLGQVILDSFDKQAKLMGLHIAVPTEVHVSVQSMTEVLADTRSRLQAAIDAAPADVLDVDVVPLGELAQ